MSLTIAQRHAWSLACTLKVCIIVFQIGDQIFGVMPSAEYDGDSDSIIREYNLWER